MSAVKNWIDHNRQDDERHEEFHRAAVDDYWEEYAPKAIDSTDWVLLDQIEKQQNAAFRAERAAMKGKLYIVFNGNKPVIRRA